MKLKRPLGPASSGAVLSLLLALPAVQPAAAEANRYDQALRAWSSVLEDHVDSRGRVDFDAVRADSADLDEYLRYVARFGPLNTPGAFANRDQRLAYYLNAYNALAMQKVIDFGVPERITGWTKLRFFALSGVEVSGKRMSLYAFENEYIRTEGDPRIHFALNCMAVSCPRLPRAPFTAESLDRDLDERAREFFSKRRNLYADHQSETIYVSEILDFFPEDFRAHAPTLIDYINRYVEPDLPADYTVSYIDYDWRVNHQHNADR